MSYFFKHFIKNINPNDVKIIFELGSRDLLDAKRLCEKYNADVFAFECNPECLKICQDTYKTLPKYCKDRIRLIDKAVHIKTGHTKFYPFDSSKYNNVGASSLLKIDFKSNRLENDPDYGKTNPQFEIQIECIRLDDFMNDMCIEYIDLLCVDLQGYELNALKSLGEYLHNVKYIITECSITSTYENGTSYKDLHDYLLKFNFKYICSNRFKYKIPDLSIKGYSEFDALFVNQSIRDIDRSDI